MIESSLESIVIYGILTVFSLGLAGVSIGSYRRSSNKKMIFVIGVFLVFFLKSVLLSVSLVNEEIASVVSIPVLGIFDGIVLVLLFMMALKR